MIDSLFVISILVKASKKSLINSSASPPASGEYPVLSPSETLIDMTSSLSGRIIGRPGFPQAVSKNMNNAIAAAFLYFFSLTPKGDTITSRESILNTAISKGNEWTIAKELELGGYIVSGAYSTDNKSTLAIFEPTGNGDYKFSTSTNRNSDEIIVGGVAINGEWYDLIWFNGAKTEYAEITYTINGQVQDTLRYNTDDMDIISIKNPEKEYSIHVAYYDNDGNKYE